MADFLVNIPLADVRVLLEKWEKRVVKHGDNKCWGWTGRLSGRKGLSYPVLRLPNGTARKARHIRVSRFLFEYYKRALTGREIVRHTCDNPICTNPKHLVAGTYKDNAQDAVARRRVRIGEQSALARITEAQALQIRRLLEKGEWQADIAREVGCGYQAVNMIAKGETWKHLGPIVYVKRKAAFCELRQKHKPGGYKTKHR